VHLEGAGHKDALPMTETKALARMITPVIGKQTMQTRIHGAGIMLDAARRKGAGVSMETITLVLLRSEARAHGRTRLV